MAEMFDYMFKDNKFTEKAGIYFLLSALASFLLTYGSVLTKLKDNTGFGYIFFACLILLFTNGYSMSCIKAVSEQKENYILPFFSLKKSFITGIKYLISILLFFIAIMSITFLVDFALAMVGVLLKSKLLAAFLVTFFGIFMILVIIYFNLAFFKIFATTESLTSFVQVVKAEEMIKKDRKHYLINTGIFVLTSIVAIVITFVIGAVEGLIIPSFVPDYVKYAISTATGALIGTYLMFVFAYLTAKATKEEV